MTEPSRSTWQRAGASLHRASLRAFDLSESAARAGWRSQQRRVKRWRSQLFMIIQISLAAGIAWGISRHVLGHPAPFLSTVAAIICLGFSFGQRVWRVVEMTVGVTIGVLMGDIFLYFFGTGVWQIILVVGVAASVTTWLGARTLMVTQSAVQAAAVMTVLPNAPDGFSRWQDALVGAAVALAFTLIAPVSPIHKPRLMVADVLNRAAQAIRAMESALQAQDPVEAERILELTRSSEKEMSALTNASNEGMAVARTSWLRLSHKEKAEQFTDLVMPLDRFMRNLRVLARRCAVATYQGEPVPEDYLALMGRFADEIDACAEELYAGRLPWTRVDSLSQFAAKTADVEVVHSLSAVVVLAQMRSMLVDLLQLCGVEHTDARDRVPEMN